MVPYIAYTSLMKLTYVVLLSSFLLLAVVVLYRLQPAEVTPLPEQPEETIVPSPSPEAENKNPEHSLIMLEYPQEGQTVSSPLRIEGKARGGWFFEATFPVVLTNWDGLIIAEGYATAQGDWMTEEFVPFTAELTFTSDTTVSNRGSLILQKANPSGLPENDDAYEITVFFEE
jgi:hypothetical protein